MLTKIAVKQIGSFLVFYYYTFYLIKLPSLSHIKCSIFNFHPYHIQILYFRY